MILPAYKAVMGVLLPQRVCFTGVTCVHITMYPTVSDTVNSLMRSKTSRV